MNRSRLKRCNRIPWTRHTFASLLIAAGKNPLYVARQMGHYLAGFTLDTYEHLMEALPRRQVEFIDEIVSPRGGRLHLNCICLGRHRVLLGAVQFYRLRGQNPQKMRPGAAACSRM